MLFLWVAVAGIAGSDGGSGDSKSALLQTPPPPVIYAPPPPPSPPPPPLRGKAAMPTPQSNPGGWVTTNDYPSSALRNEEEGVARFRLTITPVGEVSACFITQSSGSAALDETSCRLVRERARFFPAKNEKGKAVEGTYSNSIRWMIPQSVPQPKVGSMTMSFIVEKDGRQSDCRVIRTEAGMVGQLPLGPMPCSNRLIDPPFTDAKGEPVRKRVVQTMTRSLEDMID